MRKPRRSREVVVYSCQGHRLYGTSRDDALREVKLGNAKLLKSANGAGEAIQLLALDRANDASPSGIPATTMQANALGARWARDKIRVWGEMQQANLARLVAA